MADSWRDRANELTQERIQQALADLDNDAAGRETGRIKRFVTSGNVGEYAGNKNDENFIVDVASQMLTTEQQKQFERLNDRFALNDQAATIALIEIDEEIALAQLEIREIQENATVLADGTRVYRDEDNGQFYDEEDKRITEGAELEAIQRFEADDPTRQNIKSVDNRLDILQEERTKVVAYQEAQDELQERLAANPEDAAQIEAELDELPMPERVERHSAAVAEKSPQELESQSKTIFATEVLTDDLFSDAPNLSAAFTNARDNVQTTIPEAQSPKPEPAMGPS